MLGGRTGSSFFHSLSEVERLVCNRRRRSRGRIGALSKPVMTSRLMYGIKEMKVGGAWLEPVRERPGGAG